MRLSIIVLGVLLSILASQSSVLAAQTTVSGLLYINLSLTRISQVFFMNGSSSFQTNIAAEITYTGQDPPKWIAFSESSINPALRDLSNTPVAAFGNNTWVQVGTNTWKPAAMVSGPYQLPGRYNAFVTGDVNNWPNEKISFTLSEWDEEIRRESSLSTVA